MPNQAKPIATWLLTSAMGSLGCGALADAASPQESLDPSRAGQVQSWAGQSGFGKGGSNSGGLGQSVANRSGAAQAGANQAGANQAGANQAGANQAGANQAGQGGQAAGPSLHLSECEELCGRAQATGCSGGVTACAMVCATATGFATCQPQIQAWLACAKSTQVTCNENGLPVFAACDAQLTASALCAVMTVPPEPVQKSCGDFCDQLDAAGCALPAPMGNCRQACGLAGTAIPGCRDDFLDYVACAATTGVTCDATGQLNTQICSAQQRAYLGCLLLEVGASMTLSETGGAPSN